jgi:hypothetical protein
MNTTAAKHDVTNTLTALHEAIDNVRTWRPSKRRDALLAEYEAQVEEFEGAFTALVEMDEFVCEDACEVSEELDAAIEQAQAVGTIIVRNAGRMGRELDRLVSGCSTRQGVLTVWTVALEGGELRMVRHARSNAGSMVWRKA